MPDHKPKDGKFGAIPPKPARPKPTRGGERGAVPPPIAKPRPKPQGGK